MDVEQVIRENIAPVIHMSLATAKDNKPWVFEVHFAYDEDLNLYFRSLTARRHSQELTENPNVAGTIARQYGATDVPLDVSFEGTAKRLEPGKEQTKAFECLKARLQTSDAILEEAQREDGHQFYKINVSKFYVFGVFNGTGAQKYELNWNRGNDV